MSASVPRRAPATPPETGPSTYVTPTAASRVAASTAAAGPVVERSTTVVARRSSAAATASTTSSTTGPSGRLSSTVSARAATSVDAGAAVRAVGEALGRPRGVEPDQGEAGGDDPLGHRPAHVAQADEADDRGASLAPARASMPSASSTRRARRKASTPAGTPAYTVIWSRVSRSSSRVQPLRSAPRKWVMNSSGRLSAARRQRLLRLRWRSVSAERPHTPPQQYSVTSCWSSWLKLSAVDMARVTYSSPRTRLRASSPTS